MSARPVILLGMPADNQIYTLMQAALEHHGFHVISAVQSGQDFRYPSVAGRLKVKLRQLSGDKDAKRRYKSELLLADTERRILAAGGLDYALFIRGDIYSADFLNMVKRHTRTLTVNYQWDGMARFPDINSVLHLFDRCYAFDPADVRAHANLWPVTNFYFDHLGPVSGHTGGLYFVGFHMADRTAPIAAFAGEALRLGLPLDFHIGSMGVAPAHVRACYPNNIQTFQGVRSFADNLAAARQAGILADFKTPVHNGLSFRPFEALGYRKKLITTNAEIRKYDFYHPDNVFVWDGAKLDGLQAFIDTPYHELPSEIYEKYSFGNWIRYILGIAPHIPIGLPE